MRRTEPERRIRRLASDHGLAPVREEGGRHSRVGVGRARTTAPRHREIDKPTARDIERSM